MSDTLTYTNSGGLRMSADLTLGTVRIYAGSKQTMLQLSDEESTVLRALAEALHAVGDEHVRTQFACGAEECVVCLGGRTVTVIYETDGRRARDEVEAIVSWMRERL